MIGRIILFLVLWCMLGFGITVGAYFHFYDPNVSGNPLTNAYKDGRMSDVVAVAIVVLSLPIVTVCGLIDYFGGK